MSGGTLQRIEQDFMPVVVGDHFLVQADGLRVRGKPSFHDWEVFWKQLRSMEKGIQFAIGDAIRIMRAQLGEKADQIISAATGWSDSTVRNYEWMSDKVPQDVRRMDVLDMGHHQKVAHLAPREQKKWLDRAAEGDEGKQWTVSKLDTEIKAKDQGATKVYWLQVRCTSEEQRETLRKRLESEGFQTSERDAVASEKPDGDQ